MDLVVTGDARVTGILTIGTAFYMPQYTTVVIKQEMQQLLKMANQKVR